MGPSVAPDHWPHPYHGSAAKRRATYRPRREQRLGSSHQCRAAGLAFAGLLHGSDEWTAAFLHNDPASSNLLLVLIEPVTLPRLLRPWIHLDLTGLTPEEAAARLLDGVRPGPAEPTVAPAFPGRAGPGPGDAARYPGRPPHPARSANGGFRFSGAARPPIMAATSESTCRSQ